jgi:hypothetical protein
MRLLKIQPEGRSVHPGLFPIPEGPLKKICQERLSFGHLMSGSPSPRPSDSGAENSKDENTEVALNQILDDGWVYITSEVLEVGVIHKYESTTVSCDDLSFFRVIPIHREDGCSFPQSQTSPSSRENRSIS